MESTNTIKINMRPEKNNYYEGIFRIFIKYRGRKRKIALFLNCVQLNSQWIKSNNISDFLETVYLKNYDNFANRIILAPTNDDNDIINNLMLNKLCGIAKTYKSVDTLTEDTNPTAFPIEFINKCTLPGFPLHEMVLKVVCPVIL